MITPYLRPHNFAQCYRCKATYQYEEPDLRIDRSCGGMGCGYFHGFTCPSCGNFVQVRKSTSRN